jgi:hypothetical protein
MKFALTKTKLVVVGSRDADALSMIDACACIDKMYTQEYGSRAGQPLFSKVATRLLTPNEERLISALQGRFGNQEQSRRSTEPENFSNPLVVHCGDNTYVFAREHDEYAATVSFDYYDVL